MKSIDIKGIARTANGKKGAKAIRREGYVPCNLYGEARGEDGLPVAESFAVKATDLRNLVYTPDIFVVNLDIDGKMRKAVMKELQFHPVSDQILHIDFYEVSERKPIVFEVPIRMNGLAEGVKAGGKLVANVRKLKVRALYSQIPDRLDIDVTNLSLGKTVKVGELSFDGLELMTSPSVVVCQVKMTRSAISAASKAQ